MKVGFGFSLLVGLTATSALAHEFAGGAGEQNDPYRIATAEQLIAIGSDPNLLDKHFVLINDIDLDPNLPDGQVFEYAVVAPDIDEALGGFQGSVFDGSLDGRGYKIIDLCINSTSDYAGMFGLIGEKGVVQNLHLLGGSVRGEAIKPNRCGTGGLASESRGLIRNCRCDTAVWGVDYVGGLVGENRGIVIASCSKGPVSGRNRVGGLIGLNIAGTITNSFSTGPVSGRHHVGGLVGHTNPGMITNSYSIGPVWGETDVGGLIGRNRGSVLNTYSTGSVSGQAKVGGLVGDGDPIHVSNSFWNLESSGLAQSVGGLGLSMTQMQDPNTYLTAGWDFLNEVGNGASEHWDMSSEEEYPVLSVFQEFVPLILTGRGTPELPYTIQTREELSSVWYRPTAHYRVSADIDMSGIVLSNALVPTFTGRFEGEGHKICSLSICGGGNLGLIGALTGQAIVTNLGLEDVNIVGTGEYVGGLVGYNQGAISDCNCIGIVHGLSVLGGLSGYNSGEITRCFSSGDFQGEGAVGGVVGHNDEGYISQSYCTGTVSATSWRVGGLVGYNYDGKVLNSYSHVRVSGLGEVGGLVGFIFGRDSRVVSSYSTGLVQGTGPNIGGLVGYDNGDSVADSIWDRESSGTSSSDGGIGLASVEMKDPYALSLNGFGQDPNWILDAGVDCPRLAWEGTTGQLIGEPEIDWLVGRGSEEDPYCIDTSAQLFMLSKASVLWDKHFRLRSDLDLDPNLLEREVFGQAVIPEFSGSFDGNGHLISNLCIRGNNRLGMFGRLKSGASVRNLGLVHVNVVGKGSDIGGLAGRIASGFISNCLVTGSVQGRFAVGGLAGYLSGDILNCSSTADVSGTQFHIGGLVGRNGGSITNSYAMGNVRGSGDAVGGLVGRNNGYVAASYSTGSVTGEGRDVGGLVGHNSYGRLLNCYSMSSTSSAAWYAGGLVGFTERGSITNCYSTGKVKASVYARGLLGGSFMETTVSESFWDVETSGTSRSLGGTGLTTAEMQSVEPYLGAGWDFDTVWGICGGEDYPRLLWEDVECE